MIKSEKSVITCLILLSLLLPMACGHKNKALTQQLDRADSLLQTNPDSALTLLNNLGTNNDKLLTSQKLSMRYRLLMIKAHDKLYHPITGYDALVIDTLLPYFEEHGTPYLKATALFYAGRICADKGDAPQAIDYFQQALDALPEKENPRFRGLVHSQIGTLFLYQNLFEQAIDSYKLAYRFQSFDKDTIGMLFDLRDIGFSFLNNAQADSAYSYVFKALSLTRQSHNKEMEKDIMGQMANIHLSQHRFSEAKDFIMPALENIDSSSISGIYYIISNIYYNTNFQDSAIYYFNKLLQYGNVYGKQSAFLRLSEIALKENRIDRFKFFHDSLRYYDDSIKHLDNAEAVIRINSLYNYQLKERALAKLKKEELEHTMYWTFCILGLLLLLTLSAALVLFIRDQLYAERRRRRQTEELLELERKRNQSTIRADMEQIDSLQWEQSEIGSESDRQKEKLLEKIHELAKDQLWSSPIYMHIGQLLKEGRPMHEDEFSILSTEINRHFPRFKETLYSLYNMKDHEYRICMLMKLDLSITDIACLLARKDNSITMAHTRLYKKMFPKNSERPFGNLKDLVANL